MGSPGLPPSTIIPSPGYGEDTPHVSGDSGTMALVVRHDATSSLVDTDGDYAPLQVDANGRLKVDALISGASGGTAMVDDAAFTVGTTNITPAGGTYKTVRDSLDDNDGGAIALNQKRGQYVTLETSNSTEAGTSGSPLRIDPTGSTTQPVSDAGGSLTVDGTIAATQSGTWNVTNVSGTVSLPTGAATSANQTTEITSLQLIDDLPHAMNAAFVKGAAACGQFDDSTTTTATEDNIAPVRITSQRSFHVNLRTANSEAGTTTNPIYIGSGTAKSDFLKIEDDPAVDGAAGIPVFVQRHDADTSTVSATDDYSTLHVDATGFLKVNIKTQTPGTGATNLGKAEEGTRADGDTGVAIYAVRTDGIGTYAASDNRYTPLQTDTNGLLKVGLKGVNGLPHFTQNVLGIYDVQFTSIGDPNTLSVATVTSGVLNVGSSLAHDAADSGGPVKIGMRAIAHGTNPTAVAAADRTDWLANRAGIPWVIGGHPNILTLRANYTSGQTDTAVVTVSSGSKIVVTRINICFGSNVAAASSVVVGFGATNTPTTTGVLLSHPNVQPGGFISIGDGAGIIGIGADGEDLLITTGTIAVGSADINVSYYTIES